MLMVLKLDKLPDRTPVKISIVVSPDLNKKLYAYALAYKDAYGDDERVAELIPFMLDKFLATDRGFQKKRRTAE